jgi:hypothetical protein
MNKINVTKITVSEATSKCFLMIHILPDGFFGDVEGNEHNRCYLLVINSISCASFGVCLMDWLSCRSEDAYTAHAVIYSETVDPLEFFQTSCSVQMDRMPRTCT